MYLSFCLFIRICPHTDQVDDARSCQPHRHEDGDKLGQSEIQFLIIDIFVLGFT